MSARLMSTALRALVFAVLVTVAVAPATRAQEARHGRLFPPKDLGLLEGPDRETWQKPDRIMDALGIGEGSVVADLGAGGGWFTIRLARRVGPNGVVYAEDVQQEMIVAIGRRVGREGLSNVRLVRGTAADPRLPPASVDAILIVDTYNELEDPVTLLSNAARGLRPQGRIGIVDFKKDGSGGPGPPIEERPDPEAVVRDAEAAGLRLLKRETSLPYQFFLIFGR
ncbi:MAG: class I SAM-dependent methyltransferase [Vicinamibacterales bacterium]